MWYRIIMVLLMVITIGYPQQWRWADDSMEMTFDKETHLVGSFGLYYMFEYKGFSDEDMLLAGVLSQSERDGRVFDYFRDRAMFPIENRRGSVIAFGARSLGNAKPKYLNSGESLLTSKPLYLHSIS